MRILLFAHLKTMVGKAELELDFPETSTAGEFWDRLEIAYPVLKGQRKLVRLARNCEFANTQTRFANTDEVALIPPVSGG